MITNCTPADFVITLIIIITDRIGLSPITITIKALSLKGYTGTVSDHLCQIICVRNKYFKLVFTYM